MGVFCAQTAALLLRVGDHATRRVMEITHTAQLSRFVVWSADSRGFVRCWYQDEYVHMTRDHEYFSEAAWYLSGSTPYHEFRDSIAAHIAELRKRAHDTERDASQGSPLSQRPPSQIWVDGPELQKWYTRLQEQIPILEERVTKETDTLEKRKDEIARLEQDLKSQVNLLGIAHNELNALVPGAADRLKATLPPLPPIEMSMTADGQTLLSIPPVSLPAAKPGATAATAAAGSSGSALEPLPPLSASPLNAPDSINAVNTSNALAVAAPSALGIGGALQPQQGSLVPPSEVSGAANATTLTKPATALDGSSGGAGATAPSAQSGPHLGTDAMKDKAMSTNALLSLPPGLEDKSWNGVSWVNPNVGNYIQRRYYGAEPSLRTPDIMKRVPQKRLPALKVFPLQRSKSAGARSTGGPKESLKAR
ncbi:unnamed protein product [Phytomonas sp. EM1]|nr:unnamed protein product [Phytomonas sp. EM1]|eukprot:CCW63124.1 unnamed protein product [Phytomonas sp. isolate EM1]